MHRTEGPPTSVGQKDLVTRLAELAGIGSAVAGFAILVSDHDRLGRVVPIVLGASLILIGVTEIAHQQRRGRMGARAIDRGKGYGRLCAFSGLVLVAAALYSPVSSSVAGFLMTGGLLWLALRRSAARGTRGRGRSRPAWLTVITLGCLLLAYVGLVAAAVGGGGEERHEGGGGNGHEPPLESDTEPPFWKRFDPWPSYAELCPVLPDPLIIGHGIGELFRRDGAIKAGCGTRAFKVPGMATWVAAGMCSGERRSVAISAAGRPPVIVYGEAAEFVWDAAQQGVLTAVEAAAPEGGDVVLVETTAGTYGYARAKRSATPGNEDARRCDEVGGTAETFARMPPPLVWLWVELVREQATWFWPMAETAGEGEAVVFVSPQAVPRGSCLSDAYCQLEIEGETSTLEGPTFAKLDDLSEYMPAEET